ncbi:hypothetical protein BDY21DRAFT_331231 [Lineolata rhizophorae]|uniref:Homoaconitase, mitochondrial n=1 Tax=Lineolata rhizophorae TaxID=578093 RepID=A0A6A6PEH2_9PEZI|nr:hypothetical protein BDY21DRAFT_331231 [Lineolata rhizophorae]
MPMAPAPRGNALLCGGLALPVSRARPAVARQSSPRLVPLPLHRAFSSSRFRAAATIDSEPTRPFYDASHAANLAAKPTPPAPQTLTEKIVQKYSVGLPAGKFVNSGNYVTLAPHRCMTHDNSWPVALKFMSIGASKIHDPQQIVMTLDHDVQNKSESNLKKYRQIEEFAKKQNVDFYPAGRGIGHQIMVEEGYAWPGTLAVASDSHSNMYGGVGCLGTPVVRTDAASIWATGRTWWQVPPTARVNLLGTLPPGVTGKDVIVALCGLFNNDEVLNHAIEFVGAPQTLQSLSVDDRLAIANMTTEWGALSGLFPIDSVLQGWLRARATEAAMTQSSELGSAQTASRFSHARIDELFTQPLEADLRARYSKELYLDLSTLEPYVSGPNSVKIANPLRELDIKNIKLDKAYLVSCTNSRSSDIAAAARVFKKAAETNGGKIPSVPDHVKFYIAAASSSEQIAAEAQGDWQALLAAGAQPLPSGCGPCIGLGTGLLEPGEVGISASNRNFKGRMGSTNAKAYLASPEVVAASALRGKITGPGWFKKNDDVAEVSRGTGDGVPESRRLVFVEDLLEQIVSDADNLVEQGEKEFGDTQSVSIIPVNPDQRISGSITEILPGFPEKITGEIVFCDADNINTDGIYPGKYTYQDDVTRDKMSEVVMENYDPKFPAISKAGDVLVSGFNFGCGSSREQAATAILAKGIPLVVAGSFGNIFSRNSINNALLGLEVPQLIQRLRDSFSSTPPQRSGSSIAEPEENNQSLDSPPPTSVDPPHIKPLTIRTGWTLEWDVKRSLVNIIEGSSGKTWSQKTAEMPPNVQEIVANGGLENWVKKEITR